MQCAICDDKLCYPQGKDCTTDVAEQVREKLAEPINAKFSTTASALESNYYMRLTRLEETIKFAQEM